MPRDRQGRFTPADSDSFMKEWIDRGDVVIAETDNGTECIPEDVCGTPPFALDPYPADAEIDISSPDCPAEWKEWCEGTLQEYCEGKLTGEVSCKPNVYYGRYSAPGYMDCTSWSWGRNKRQLERELRSMYGSED